MNELVTIEEPLMVLLKQWIEPCPGNFIPGRQIFEKVKTLGGRALEIDVTKDKVLDVKIAGCLQKLGYEKTQLRHLGEKTRGYRGLAWRKGHYP